MAYDRFMVFPVWEQADKGQERKQSQSGEGISLEQLSSRQRQEKVKGGIYGMLIGDARGSFR